MTLTRKILLVIGPTIFLFFTVLFLTSRIFLLQSFSQIEEQKMITNVGRAESGYEDLVNDIEVAISDWSLWDDTYKFVDDLNEAYIESNISSNALTNLNINYMIFVNKSGEIVFSQEAAIDKEIFPNLKDDLLYYILNSKLLNKHNNPKSSVAGLIMLPDRTPIIVSSQPIVKSDGEGPVNGTLVFARLMDETVIEELRERVHLSLDFYNVNSLDNLELNSAYDFLQSREIYTNPHENYIYGYKIIHDLEGKPAFILKVELVRDIYQQGLKTINYFLLFVVAIGIVITIVTALFLSITIIKPIKTLITATHQIAEGKFEERVEVSSKDELGTLAQTFNLMTEKLDKTFRQLRETQERELKKAKELVKLKDEFVFIAAHELRTPVIIITGFVDIIGDSLKKLPSDVRDSFENLTKAANRLEQLVNDLLQTARSESGTIKVTTKDVDLSAFLKDLLTNFEEQLKEKNLSISLKLDSGIKSVRADEGKLSEVVSNFITNAIKYNEKGGSVTVVTEETEGMAKVTVKDTGVGIPLKQQEKIFQKFFRAHQPGTEEVEGTGLGLFVTKMLVEKMGGKIGFVSKENRGSEFWFTLPLA